ncbi:MAG: hypothetical protein R3C40_07720 [Parvularculaceae bacterium]
MKEISDNGETAHLLGSEAAATMLLHWAGKGARAIEAAIGHGENLAARRLAGNITVIPEAESRLIGPEYLIVPAALKREAQTLARSILQGMKLIFVTPGVYVVHAGNYAAEYGKSLGSSDGAADVDSLRSILSAAGDASSLTAPAARRLNLTSRDKPPRRAFEHKRGQHARPSRAGVDINPPARVQRSGYRMMAVDDGFVGRLFVWAL